MAHARWRESLARYFVAWLAIYEISGNLIDAKPGSATGCWPSAWRAMRCPTRFVDAPTFACQLADRYLQSLPRRGARHLSTNNW